MMPALLVSKDRVCRPEVVTFDGRYWNKKRIHRVYCDMGSNSPRRWKKWLPERSRQPRYLVRSPTAIGPWTSCMTRSIAADDSER